MCSNHRKSKENWSVSTATAFGKTKRTLYSSKTVGNQLQMKFHAIFWFDHFPLEFGAETLQFRSTHGYYKSPKYERQTPFLSSWTHTSLFGWGCDQIKTCLYLFRRSVWMRIGRGFQEFRLVSWMLISRCVKYMTVWRVCRSVFFNKIMLTFQQEDLSSGKFMLKKSKISEKNLRERGFLVPKLKGFAT